MNGLASLASLGFAQPLWLWLVPLAALPLLTDGAAQRRHGWLALLPADRASVLLQWALRALGALAVAAIVAALAGIYRPEYEVERVGRGAEIVLLLDRSRSMDERFVVRGTGGPAPGTAAWYAYNQADGSERISKGQAARRILGEFAAKRADDRFAMALFSTLPIGLFDFTQKPDIVQAAIAAGEVGRGLNETDISAALMHGLGYFDRRPYTGSRIVLLVSDGGDHIDPGAKLLITERLREQRVALYWIYIRSARSPGLTGKDASDAVPEVSLDRYFRSTAVPYRVYEAESPEALKQAIDDVGRLENLPISYLERVPRRDLSTWAYALALAAVLVLLASRWKGVPHERRGVPEREFPLGGGTARNAKGAPVTPIRPRLRLRLVVGLLLALALAAAADGWRWWQKHAANASIAAGIATRPALDSRPELRFAHASGLAARSEREAAIDAYRLLQDDTPLGQAARFNASNQLLLQALVLRNSPLPGQALPLLELAKAGYREVLRVDPNHWDARYNLERAQRLQPDPDDIEADPAGPPENAERAATTMRGVSRGLP